MRTYQVVHARGKRYVSSVGIEILEIDQILSIVVYLHWTGWVFTYSLCLSMRGWLNKNQPSRIHLINQPAIFFSQSHSIMNQYIVATTGLNSSIILGVPRRSRRRARRCCTGVGIWRRTPSGRDNGRLPLYPHALLTPWNNMSKSIIYIFILFTKLGKGIFAGVHKCNLMFFQLHTSYFLLEWTIVLFTYFFFVGKQTFD